MIDFSALGLRDVILIAATLVAAYVLFSLLPLLRMVGKSHRAAGPAQSLVQAPAPTDAEPEPASWREAQRNEPRFPPHGSQAESGEEGREAEVGGFASELAASSRDLEIRRLRREMDQVLADMARLSEEFSSLRASRNVSPQYSEAMTLARQGETPDGIASRCGISIGEAELVAALARGRSGAASDEADGNRYTDN